MGEIHRKIQRINGSAENQGQLGNAQQKYFARSTIFSPKLKTNTKQNTETAYPYLMSRERDFMTLSFCKAKGMKANYGAH